jgi:hypothetical protein
MKIGHRNEDFLLRATESHPCVVPGTLAKVGALQMRGDFAMMMCSPDAVALGVVPMDVATPMTSVSLATTTTHQIVLPIECKTVVSRDRENEFRMHRMRADEFQAHLEDEFGGPTFVRLVDKTWWGQLIHTITVLQTPAVLLVVGDRAVGYLPCW